MLNSTFSLVRAPLQSRFVATLFVCASPLGGEALTCPLAVASPLHALQ